MFDTGSGDLVWRTALYLVCYIGISDVERAEVEQVEVGGLKLQPMKGQDVRTYLCTAVIGRES